MPFDDNSFDEELDPPKYLWAEQPLETYRGFHIFDVIHPDGSPVGFGVVKDEPNVDEQAPLGEIPFETLEQARSAIDEAVEMRELIDKP